MSITFSRSYVCSDNQVFATLKLAQEHEIAMILQATLGKNDGLTPVTAASIIVNKRETMLDILTTTNKSRPGARKINKGPKPAAEKQEAA